jgi:diguanylate cyclase (GGDEF)-like protein
MGFPHPDLGYVSFDRVAQVSSILVLGPILASIITGIASIIFALFSRYFSNSKRGKIIAALNNSAMMALMVFISGVFYLKIGGSIPFKYLDGTNVLYLLVLLVSMQLINSLGMLILLKLREQNLATYFSWLPTFIELGSGFGAILFAVICNRMELATITLYIFIMVIAIFVMNQFALMRNRLDSIVEKRTYDLEMKTKQLEYLATYDDMTGLVNRRHINNHIKCLLEKQTIDNKGIYIAFADIDDFKKINDDYSHDMGDEVLTQIGKILQQFSHEMLIIARYGGEEFLLCFDSTQKDVVIKTCEQIRQAVKSVKFQHNKHQFNTTVSMGIANANKHSLHKTLISRADQCLYEAKHKGKDQIIYSD